MGRRSRGLETPALVDGDVDEDGARPHPPHHLAADELLRAEGAGSKVFREAMESKILPRVASFAPDLIVISAGFDGHRFDPIGGLHLEVADFTWITNKLMEIAERRAKGRIVSILEGGYDLVALARCASAHVQTLMRA